MAGKIHFMKATALAGALGFFLCAGNVQAKNIENQAPVLSGTSWFQIKQGEAFDEKDIMARVYAFDYEDGDLTQEIQVTSNEVNTEVCGEYSVSYLVTDTEGNTSTMKTQVSVVSAYPEEFGRGLSKKLYTKENADHLLKEGVYRGYEHDRQHLGIYLPENTVLHVTVANAEEFFQNYQGDLVIDLLADDSEAESSHVIPKDVGEWAYISSENGGYVPFVRTPQSEVQPILMYYVGEAEPLTYYHYGDDQKAFSEQWNKNQHEFAVLDSERITMLVPRKDIAILPGETGAEDNKMFESLDEMLEFYKNVQERYDEFIGVSYQPEEAVDKNIRAKYFLKADVHGVGAAYYNAAMYIAQNADTVRGYLGYDYWMSLHEVAHGYDGDFTQGDLEMGEMINNIFAHYYERTLDSRVWESEGNGWGYLQNMPAIESYYQQLVEQQGTYSEMDFPTRLYCFLNLLNKTDAQKMMSNLHKEWRRHEGASVKDFVVEQFCEESGYNLIPYFESIGIYVSDFVKSQIYEKKAPFLTSLAGCFAKTEDAQTAMQRLNGNETDPFKMVVNGRFGMVNNEELAKLNLKGTIKIQIEIDELKPIKGQKAVLLDGEKEIAAVDVESAQIVFENIPIGEYRLQLPAVKGVAYYADYQPVKAVYGAETEYTVVYHKADQNLLKNDTRIQLLGLSDHLIAEVITDIDQGKVHILNKTNQPHYVFHDIYTAVKVLDGKTNQLLGYQAFIGDKDYAAAEVIVDAPVGSVIEIYHKEINIRMKVVSEATGLTYEKYTEGLTADSRTEKYVITENGLKRIQWDDDTYEQNRVAFFEHYAKQLEETIGEKAAKDPLAYSKQKAELASVVRSFSKENQQDFEEKYPYLFTKEDVTEVFSDVFDEWYKESVQYVYDRGYMTGTNVLFNPTKNINRAQFVVTLYRLAGEPEVTNRDAMDDFSDVPEGSYFVDAVCWAYDYNITTGSNGKFNPYNSLSRQQLATFLHRFAQQIGADVSASGDYSSMPGAADVQEYAKEAMKWAVGSGIISGSGANKDLKPKGNATRAQLATILQRFCESNEL